jgi:hypothetical protein
MNFRTKEAQTVGILTVRHEMSRISIAFLNMPDIQFRKATDLYLWNEFPLEQCRDTSAIGARSSFELKQGMWMFGDHNLA